ncbi:MAG: hypothetical protein AAGE59_12225 [Cyanobacteria bacterium P01_F01_bin.86]
MRAILYHHSRSRRLSEPKARKVPPQARSSVPKQKAALLSIVCDFMFLMVTVGVALVFRALVISLWPAAANADERSLVEWLPVIALVSGWLFYLGLDALRGTHPSRLVPFEYTERVVQHIYLRRVEVSLWTLASSLILLSLCLFFVRTPLVSKLFFASLVGLVVLTVRKSIPLRRLSLAIATGIFFVTMVAIAIASVATT